MAWRRVVRIEMQHASSTSRRILQRQENFTCFWQSIVERELHQCVGELNLIRNLSSLPVLGLVEGQASTRAIQHHGMSQYCRRGDVGCPSTESLNHSLGSHHHAPSSCLHNMAAAGRVCTAADCMAAAQELTDFGCFPSPITSSFRNSSGLPACSEFPPASSCCLPSEHHCSSGRDRAVSSLLRSLCILHNSSSQLRFEQRRFGSSMNCASQSWSSEGSAPTGSTREALAKRQDDTVRNAPEDGSSSQVHVEYLKGPAEGIVRAQLCRGSAKNAIGREMLQGLRALIHEIESKKSVRVLILSSGVEGVFSAGADLKERRTMSVLETREFVNSLRETFLALEKLHVPTIAAIEGVALGGGLELALACDLRVCGAAASFGLPETSLAIIPGAGGTQRLPRIIGRAKAKELIFTGRRVSSEEALQLGLVNHREGIGCAYQKALSIAREILPKGPLAVRLAKEAISLGIEIDTEAGLALEGARYSQVLNSVDRLEGLQSFSDKRTPLYIGE